MLSFIGKKNCRALVALGTLFCLLVIGGCATNKSTDIESAESRKISVEKIRVSRAAEQEQCWKTKGFTKKEMKEWLVADIGLGYSGRNCYSEILPRHQGINFDYVSLVVIPLKELGITLNEAKSWKMAGLSQFNYHGHSGDPKKHEIFDHNKPGYLTSFIKHLRNLGYSPKSFSTFFPVISKKHEGNYVARMNTKEYNTVEEAAANEFPFKNTAAYKSARAIHKKKRNDVLVIMKNDNKDILAAKNVFQKNKGNLKVGYLVCSSQNKIAFVDRIAGDRVKLDLKAQGDYFHYSSTDSYVKKLRRYELFRTDLPSFKYHSLKGQTWDSTSAWAQCSLNTSF